MKFIEYLSTLEDFKLNKDKYKKIEEVKSHIFSIKRKFYFYEGSKKILKYNSRLKQLRLESY